MKTRLRLIKHTRFKDLIPIGEMPHLLVPVALSDVDTGQVGHDESPQFLVCSKLRRKGLRKLKLAGLFKQKKLYSFNSPRHPPGRTEGKEMIINILENKNK